MDMQNGWVVGWMVGWMDGWVERDIRRKGEYKHYLSLSLSLHRAFCSLFNYYTDKCTYVGYSESKYRLCISLAHPRDRHFAHVQ